MQQFCKILNAFGIHTSSSLTKLSCESGQALADERSAEILTRSLVQTLNVCTLTCVL